MMLVIHLSTAACLESMEFSLIMLIGVANTNTKLLDHSTSPVFSSLLGPTYHLICLFLLPFPSLKTLSLCLTQFMFLISKIPYILTPSLNSTFIFPLRGRWLTLRTLLPLWPTQGVASLGLVAFIPPSKKVEYVSSYLPMLLSNHIAPALTYPLHHCTQFYLMLWQF